MDSLQSSIQLIAVTLVLTGISALIAWRASSRRRVLIMLLWLLWPVLLMAAVLVLGSLFSPAREGTASNAIFAIMLIGTIALVPWLVLCAVGYAVGLVLRGKWPPAASVVEAPPPSAPPQPMAAPSSAERAIAPPSTSLPQHHLAANAAKPHVSQESPDGSVRVDIEPVEWGNSQWVHTPRVVETANGRILCDLFGTDWQADTAFPRERYVWLGLRRYRSPGHLFAEFDLDADRYRIALRSLDLPDEEGPLGDISARLEAWWARATALASTSANQPPAPPSPPGPFAAWRTALVILVGALAAIAGLTWFSMKTGIEPPKVPLIIRVPSAH